MKSTDSPLELSGEQLRQLVDVTMQRIVAHIDSLPQQPAWNSDGDPEFVRGMAEPLPQRGAPTEKLLDELFERLVPVSYNTASPGYMAYIPGGGLPHSAVADLIADCVNRYTGVWIAAPGLVQLEANVIRWFCDVIGYPAESGGFLTTGGSLSNWSAIVTARRCRLPDDFLSATIYTSNQAHFAIQKAAMLAGFPPENVRKIEVDAQFRVRTDRLEEQIERDERDGLVPFALIGHAGTVNTGAVDDLSALADLADKRSLWFHVDAAYGGFFMLTERGRAVMRGIERADSITLDPHKGLFLPYGTGCLLARDRRHLKQAHTVTGEYMPPMQQDGELVDFCEVSPELSRDFRGLRVWLPLKMAGIEPFRRALEEKLDLAQWATRELRTIDSEIDGELEIIAAPQLSVLAFRLRRAGLDEAALRQLNEKLRDQINAPRRVFLTPTVLDGRYVIRICILHLRTHRDRVSECLELIRSALKTI